MNADTTAMLGGTITASAVSVFLINALKNARWFPLLQKESVAAGRIFGILFAAASALGIHAAFTGGTLTITGLTLTGVLGAGWLWLKSFALQEWIYQSSRVKTLKLPAESSGK